MYTILHTCTNMYVCTLCFEIQCLLTHPNRAERLQGFSLLPLRLVDAQEVQHLAQLGPPRAGVFQQLVLHKEIVRGLEVPLDACSHIQIHTYIQRYFLRFIHLPAWCTDHIKWYMFAKEAAFAWHKMPFGINKYVMYVCMYVCMYVWIK